MTKIDTEENRFHALKFALTTPYVSGAKDILDAAEVYLAFLEGKAKPEPQAEPEAWVPATTAPVADEPVELEDLTESYPAEEPEPVVAVVDSWAAADLAISDEALVQELFEDGPHETEGFVYTSVADIGATLHDTTVTLDADEPTFEYVAEAVAQIASPPPPAPDATDEPELTDEQVERIEERLATPDPITAAEADPERELETAGGYVNALPRHRWPWMGS